MKPAKLLQTAAGLAVLYAFCTQGRTGHPILPELRRHVYTHRGLYDNEAGIPENSLAAFRRTAEHPGFGCEFDVHMIADGTLVVVHDSDLTRSCGFGVDVEDLTADQLKDYPLFGTDEIIPTLDHVLEVLGAAGAPLVVEVKTHKGNAAALTAATVEALKNYPAPYCVESFDPWAVYWLKKNAPHICRGQLSCNFVKEPLRIPLLGAVALTGMAENVLTMPDFVAYRFEDRKLPGVVLSDKLWGVAQVRWTIRNQKDLDTAVKENCIPIFEHFIPEGY